MSEEVKPKVFRAVYISKSLLNKEGESELLIQAQSHNALNNITGILFHHRGKFLQILEGEETKVLALLERIMTDPRHKNFQLLTASTVPEGMFEGWTMASASVNRDQFQAAVAKFSTGASTLDRVIKNWVEN